MRLGDYVEISTTVDNDETAASFYTSLGFQHADYRVVTDGRININLAPSGVPAPMLRYAGSDIDAVAALVPGLERLAQGIATFTTPEGLRVMLSPYASRVPMPDGTPLSRCGTFGEYALPVANLSTALAFWEPLGFKPLHTSTEPYPWAIVSDELIVLGLHQTHDFHEPHMTYFASDMVERIAALQGDGFQMTPLPDMPDCAALRGPGGEQFFLFPGQI